MYNFHQFFHQLKESSRDSLTIDVKPAVDFFTSNSEFLEEYPDETRAAIEKIEQHLKTPLSHMVSIDSTTLESIKALQQIFKGLLNFESDWHYEISVSSKSLYHIGDFSGYLNVKVLDYQIPIIYITDEGDNGSMFIFNKDHFLAACYLSGEEIKGYFFKENILERFARENPRAIMAIKNMNLSHKFGI